VAPRRPLARLIGGGPVRTPVDVKGQVPRRVTASALASVLQSLGYSVRRGAFEVSGRRAEGKRRFHITVDTYGQAAVPRDAEVDVHIDLTADIQKYHRSVPEGPEIAAEMERFLVAVSRGGDGGVIWGTCPECGKSFAAEALASHVKVVHGTTRARRAR